MLSIEIGDHKFGVEEQEDGTLLILGCFLEGRFQPEAKDLPEGYIVQYSASAALEQLAETAKEDEVTE